MDDYTYSFTKQNKSSIFHYYMGIDEVGTIEFINFGNGYTRITHTELHEYYRGKGYGSIMVLALIQYFENEDKKIIYECPYAKNVAIDHNKLVNVSYDDFDI